ncbi:unnamed protein product [Caenorhabditis bovis]|uniref:CULT domain-containing protein n=1 Tax=Caenorhabditis bovis TaxID=2654633 RepID=A0A8S1F8A7_9PELO|nr:unnamed protein product [Caenorhabditis bovis]
MDESDHYSEDDYLSDTSSTGSLSTFRPENILNEMARNIILYNPDDELFGAPNINTNRLADFNPDLTQEHPYLFQLDVVMVEPPEYPKENEIIRLRSVKASTVIFPGQKVPMNNNYGFDNFSTLHNEKLVVLLLFENERDYHLHRQDDITLPRTAVIAKITKFTADRLNRDTCKRIEFEAIQRCKVLDLEPDTYATVKVLPETREYCEELLTYFAQYYPEERLRTLLENDIVEFGFWACSNIFCVQKVKYQLLEMKTTDERIATVLELARKIKSFKCKNCGDVLSDTSKVVRMGSHEIAGQFVNPGGVVHDLITVREIRNYQFYGSAVQDFSWFPGYSWTIIQCACGTHIGWMFESRYLRPTTFYALSRPNIKNEEVENDEENKTVFL